jgi:hypothetical protein
MLNKMMTDCEMLREEENFAKARHEGKKCGKDLRNVGVGIRLVNTFPPGILKVVLLDLVMITGVGEIHSITVFGIKVYCIGDKGFRYDVGLEGDMIELLGEEEWNKLEFEQV